MSDVGPDYGTWTYAISAGNGTALPDLAGVGGAAVRQVTCAGLSVLVSDVRLAEFGEAALRRNLEDLDWLEAVARQHHGVIDAAARLVPLLPARLATVYSSDAAMGAELASRAGKVRAALQRVGGRAEWGVKAYSAAPPADAAPDPAGDPDAGEGPGPGAGGPASERAGAGLAYLKRRRAQLSAGRERQAAAADGARAVYDGLTDQAAGARLHPPQVPQLSGIREPMLLNAAYLVDDDAREDFAAAVTALAAAHPELRVELTGPWPPYSFAGQDDDGSY